MIYDSESYGQFLSRTNSERRQRVGEYDEDDGPAVRTPVDDYIPPVRVRPSGPCGDCRDFYRGACDLHGTKVSAEDVQVCFRPKGAVVR